MYQPTPVGHSKSRVFIVCLLAFSILTPIAITVVTASSRNATAGTTVNSVLGFIVNTLGDAPDPSLDGICDTDAGTVGDQCTLRAAIQEANNASSDDTIGFDAALNGGTITLGTALDAIDGNLTINGPGATLLTVARSAGPGTPDFRIFTINSSRVVTISGLTISNGLTSTGVDGGAILNSGTLTLTGCRLQDNESGGTGGCYTQLRDS